MRTLTTILLGIVMIAVGSVSYAFGPPDYFPDGAHPRIFLTPTKLAALKNKVTANDADWQALKASADNYVARTVIPFQLGLGTSAQIYYNYQGANWRLAMLPLCLAYKVSGNAAYAAKAKEIVQVMVASGLSSMAVDSGYPSRNIAVAMAIAYDWLYDFLDPETKASMIPVINTWFDWSKANTYQRSDPTGTSNYFGGDLIGYGLCGIATYGDNPRAGEIYSYVRNFWTTSIIPAFTTGAFVGGYPSESYSYGAEQFVFLMELAEAIESGTGENLFSDYPTRIATSMFHNLKPNGWQITVEGDWPGSYAGLASRSLPSLLSTLIDSNIGNYSKYLANNLATPPLSSAIAARDQYPFQRFMRATTKVETDYKGSIGLYYRSLGDEHVISRSDWTPGATWSSYNGGSTHFASHQILGAGHIEVQRGSDNLLVTAGQWKGATGFSGSPSNYKLASIAANTLYFYDGGAYMTTTSSTFDGGQTYYGKTDTLKYEGTSTYQYMKSNLTSAYKHNPYPVVPSTLSYFYRNYLSLWGGEVIVVYDRIRATTTSYTKRLQWYLNIAGSSSLNNNSVTSTVGTSKLYLQTLYPSGVTTTISDNPSIYGGVTLYSKRVEVSGPSSTDFNPLTVMITSSNTKTTPLTTLVQSVEGKMMGAYINDQDKPAIVMFSADEDGNDVIFALGEIMSYSIISPLANLQQILLHLVPNSYLTLLPATSSNGLVTYKFKSGMFPDEGTVYKASPQGVISFLAGAQPVTPSPPAAPTGVKKVS